MATANRRPLATRPVHTNEQTLSPLQHLKSTQLSKRPRSPDSAAHSLGTLVKRFKPTALSSAPHTLKDARKDRKYEVTKSTKDQQKAEREQQRLEFKEKYCRAFPNWTFYLDSDTMETNPTQLYSFQARVLQLGAKIEHFFSSDVTHVISNCSVPGQSDGPEKENLHRDRGSSKPLPSSKSPTKARAQQPEEPETNKLITQALKFNIKIWNTLKLESVLSRCLEEPPVTLISHIFPTKQKTPNTLSKLLQSERIHGSSERDPTQKRHDFRYFTRGNCFVLIEDMRGELATIASHEYPPYKDREGEKTPWPTLHCHPQARGPFIPFDEKEKKRWDRLLQAEQKDAEERKNRRELLLKRQLVEKRADPHSVVKRVGDLRRSASMNNLQRAAHLFVNPLPEHDVEGDESAHASGYLASGVMNYMAASGNSVGITSTTGTTSTANSISRNIHIPSNLSGHLLREVVMRKQPQERLNRANTMAPPVNVPQRATALLRKSKSTNTLKLPKREEGSKPGYCESCRQKFEDFKMHIESRRHRKFAEDDNNFLQLDYILERVQRRTLQERQQLNNRRYTSICRQITN